MYDKDAMPANVAVCTACEEIGSVHMKTPGTKLVQVLLLVLYIAPGLIYWAWRKGNRKLVCSACGSDKLVSAQTRIGKKIVLEQHPNTVFGSAMRIRTEKPSTFGKLTGVLMGMFAACATVLAFFTIQTSFTVGFASVLLGAMLWFTTYRLWTAKPTYEEREPGLIAWAD